MKRLFIAIDVDEPTRDAIGHISSGLRQSVDPRAKVSWVRPDRMHLTLHFSGQAEESMERRLVAALAEPLPEAPFGLSFEGVGFFPASGSPRVLWLGVREGLSELRRVQQILVGRIPVGRDFSRALPTLPAGGNERFAPHLTLARLRDRVPRDKLEEIASIQAAAGPCRIDRVTLYESRLSLAGPTYLRLAEASLTR